MVISVVKKGHFRVVISVDKTGQIKSGYFRA